jgi:hypothetical protein
MKNRLHVIPLDRLIEIEPPPRERRRKRDAAAWPRLQTLAGRVNRFERWHWCLLFALCTSLISGILLLCSVNPHGLSLFLLLPGLIYPLQLDSPNTRQYHAVGVLVITYCASGLTGLACCVYHCFA